MSKRVTVADIAKELNVSKSTVSIALSNKYGVSENMRANIVLTAFKMGYDFGKQKKESAKRKKRSVALIIDSIDVLEAPFWEEIIRSIEKNLSLANKMLKIVVVKQYNNYNEIALTLMNEVEGIFVLSCGDAEGINILQKLSIPIILLDAKDCVILSCSQIRIANYESGYIAAEFFYERGHRNIAFFGSKDFSSSFYQRESGFKAFAETNGVPCKIYDGTDENNKKSGYSKNDLNKLLTENEFPLAVFCGNDYIAYYLYTEAEKKNIKIPDELSIIGFDNVPLEADITTIDIPKDAFGKKAVSLMLDSIKGVTECKETICINCNIIDRNTVKTIN